MPSSTLNLCWHGNYDEIRISAHKCYVWFDPCLPYPFPCILHIRSAGANAGPCVSAPRERQAAGLTHGLLTSYTSADEVGERLMCCGPPHVIRLDGELPKHPVCSVAGFGTVGTCIVTHFPLYLATDGVITTHCHFFRLFIIVLCRRCCCLKRCVPCSGKRCKCYLYWAASQKSLLIS